MTIPQSLIDAIERGDCTYECAALGAAGAYSIPVPKSGYIVIFGFTFNHFFDTNTPLIIQKQLEALVRGLHHVQFQSKTGRYIYNFRSIPKIIDLGPFIVQFPLPVGNFKILPSNGAENISCYQIHKEDINITIWDAPSASDWTYVFAPIPAHKGTIENPNLGIGMGAAGISTVQHLEVEPIGNPNWVINPVNQNNLPADGSKIDLTSPINDDTRLFPPNKDKEQCMYSFPLLNVYYCVFNKASRKTQRE